MIDALMAAQAASAEPAAADYWSTLFVLDRKSVV